MLRMLSSHAVNYNELNTWDYRNEKGQSIIDIVNEHPEICLHSPESEYLPVVNDWLDHITILSNQLSSWIPFTNRWLNNHIIIPYEVIYTKGPNDKLKYLTNGDWLIEDYPKFSDYNNIVLIDRPYNQSLDVPIRVRNPKQLIDFLINVM